jgi:hypothetical protein
VSTDLFRACAESLERSRARRHAVALRLADLRRRGRRGSGATAAALTALLALGVPLAVGQTTAQAPSAGGVLTSGTAGDEVSAVQAALGLRQTGRFDAATTRAVRRFQRREGLAVDGIVGPQTRAALGLAPVSTAAPADAAPAAAAGAQPTLARIAQCESGGDPTAVSADGRYRGKYQFSRETWNAMGGSGDPAAAPEAEQDRLAAALLAARGTAPWPSCA